MQPPHRYTRVSTAEVESQFHSTDSSPADAPITTTFYADIRAASDASQDEILEAAVRRFTELLGENEHQTQLNTLFAAFSTLYDLNKRAAYDRYGDALFEKLDISSGASAGHPTLYDRQLYSVDQRVWPFLRRIWDLMVLCVVIGWIAGGDVFSTVLLVVTTVIPFAILFSNCKDLIVLKNTLSTIWTMVFDSHSQIAAVAHDEQQPQTISSSDSATASHSQRIRSFGIRQFLIQLPDIAISALCAITSVLLILIFYIYGSTDQLFGKFSKYGLVIVFSIMSFKLTSLMVQVACNESLVQTHLMTLFQEMRNRGTPSGYQHETYMSKLQDSIGQAKLSITSPLLGLAIILPVCLVVLAICIVVSIKSWAMGVLAFFYGVVLFLACCIYSYFIHALHECTQAY
ncbi:hypothetical protein GQ42DRAFT_29024 [Ramicandelaber brevisporus]|nr:hypothetical protein GQ42DRAFT_29024 [Ramicandelaber brevisporus]